MTDTPITQAERDELRKLSQDTLQPPWEQLSGRHLSVDRGDRPQVFHQLQQNEIALILEARNALPRLLDALDSAEERAEAAEELIAAARYDVGERSFLEDAQNILKECVAPYSCEQMQAVAKVLRQWRDKWAILLETVVRSNEERDALKAKLDEEDWLTAPLTARELAAVHAVEIDSLKAKLAALVDAASSLIDEHGVTPAAFYSPVQRRFLAAIEAAKVTP